MTQKQTHTLWFNLTQTTYYVIPDDQQLPKGNFVLINFKGQWQRVKQNSVSPYLAGETILNNYISAATTRFFSNAETILTNTLNTIIEGNSTPSDPPYLPLSLIAKLFSLSVKTLQEDPKKALQKGLFNIATKIAYFLDDAISEDEEKYQNAQRQIQALMHLLQERGFEPNPNRINIPTVFHTEYAATAHKEDFYGLIRIFRVFATEVQEPKEGAIDTAFRNFAQGFYTLLQGDAQTVTKRVELYKRLIWGSVNNAPPKH